MALVATSVLAIASCHSNVSDGCGSEAPARPSTTFVPDAYGLIRPVENVDDPTLFDGSPLLREIVVRVGAQTVTLDTTTRSFGMCSPRPGRCAAFVRDIDSAGTAGWVSFLPIRDESKATVSGRIAKLTATRVVLDTGLTLALAPGVAVTPCNETSPTRWGPGYTLELSPTGTITSARCLICFD